MLPKWLWTWAILLLEGLSARRDACLRLAMAQLEMAKSRLAGNRVILAPEERNRLLRLGSALSHEVHDVLGIVSVKTYKRWLREQDRGREAGRVGRRRVVSPSLRALILRLARENVGWGVRRIIGELRKLALPVSRSTVRRVLVDEGLLPDPDRHAPKGVTTPWRIFIRAHMNTMVAFDFFCKTVWTPVGKRVAYILMFIHLGTRKVTISPATFNPTGEWMQQQAHNVTMWMEDEGIDLRHLIHDRDTKFTEAFDEHFRRTGNKVVKTPFVAPMANCFCESWIGSFKREVLNHLFCFSLRHVPPCRLGQPFTGFRRRPDEAHRASTIFRWSTQPLLPKSSVILQRYKFSR